MDIPHHGGDVYSYEQFYTGELIDFSSNINPLGFPKELKSGIIERFEEVLAYPDLEYRELKQNVSDYLNVDVNNVAVGNGAVEIIDAVISHFKRLILVEPCFSEYRLRGEVHNLDIISIDAREDLRIPLEEIKKTIQEGDLLILTNPHNPTGYTLTQDEILEIYMDILEKDAYLLLDEAFFEFANLDYDSINLFKSLGFSNVGIIRAATKFFALPGLRLGYGVFDDEMLEKIKRTTLPWTVNSFAVIGSSYIFNWDYINKSREYIFHERNRFMEELSKIKGVYPYTSNSNYILLKLEGISENMVFQIFLKTGILVRRCSNYRNLYGTHIRVAIKTTELNNRLINTLKNIMEDRDGIFI